MNLDELGQLARHNFWTTFKPADCERADAHSYEEGAKFGYALAQDQCVETCKQLAQEKDHLAAKLHEANMSSPVMNSGWSWSYVKVEEMTRALAEWKEREKLWTEMMDRQDAATRKAEAELAELITIAKNAVTEIQAQKTMWPGEVDTLIDWLKEHGR